MITSPAMLKSPNICMNEKKCRETVLDRSQGRCERCNGTWPPVTLHHRRKRSSLPKARMWEPANCVMLCGHGTSMNACHSWVEANPAEAEISGWHVRPWQEPAEIPALLHGRKWVRLDEHIPQYNLVVDEGEKS